MAKQKDSQQLAVQEKSAPLVPAVDIMNSELPDLRSEGKVMPIDLGVNYWTPEQIGEQKFGFIQKVQFRPYKSMQDTELIEDIETVIFIEQLEDLTVSTTANASKRLVSDIKRNFEEGKIVEGNPVVITYLGKKQNSSNSYKSDSWSVKPIAINQ